MKKNELPNEPIFPISFNDRYYVATANDFIKGKQKMTLQESKLFAIVLSQIVKEDKEFKTYTTNIPELAKFMNMDVANLYREIDNITSALMTRFVQIRDKSSNKERWIKFHLISRAEYDDGKLVIRLSDEIRPFVLQLNKLYSQTVLGTIMSFHGYYALRLFQYVKCERDASLGHNVKTHWEFSCEEIRELFQTYVKDEKGKIIKELYNSNRDLILKTIVPALSEIGTSEYAYVFDYKVLKDSLGKRGRPSIVGVEFSALIFDKKGDKEKYFLERIVEPSARKYYDSFSEEQKTKLDIVALKHGTKKEQITDFFLREIKLEILKNVTAEQQEFLKDLIKNISESKKNIPNFLCENDLEKYFFDGKLVVCKYEYLQNFWDNNYENTSKNAKPCSTAIKEKNVDDKLKKDTEKSVKNQINYDALLKHYDQSSVDEVVNVMTEIYITNAPIKINKIDMPSKAVHEVFSKISEEKIRYVLSELKATTSKITNRRAYIMTCIYNTEIHYPEIQKNKSEAEKYAEENKPSYDLERWQAMADSFDPLSFDFSDDEI